MPEIKADDIPLLFGGIGAIGGAVYGGYMNARRGQTLGNTIAETCLFYTPIGFTLGYICPITIPCIFVAGCVYNVAKLL